MTAAQTPKLNPITYSDRAISRANRALRCLPFRQPLFATMSDRRVPLNAIAGISGVQNQYTERPLIELIAENHLAWLIQVGVLRREVDGQGITDSFRLTPLGRQCLAQNPDSEFPRPTWGDRLLNALSRWLRLRFLG
ncbi:MAG: hypothetical protein SAJ11_14800 [Jaaginema sp. PMC 1078.18]|nr:hypothetical protein [Jaaginema sp. PMC 1078.18]